jgi:hypothetical protein
VIQRDVHLSPMLLLLLLLLLLPLQGDHWQVLL